jgi:hypothetical protein
VVEVQALPGRRQQMMDKGRRRCVQSWSETMLLPFLCLKILCFMPRYKHCPPH